MGKTTNTTIHKPVIEDNETQNDLIDSLNKLYRSFQDEYIVNSHNGETSVVSKSHLICNGSTGKRIVTLPELLVNSSPEIDEIRSFITLLPSHAHFEIIHFPQSYDIFSIRWNKNDI
jgi:hypothetical protein